jgi:hypothetical protein
MQHSRPTRRELLAIGMALLPLPVFFRWHSIGPFGFLLNEDSRTACAVARGYLNSSPGAARRTKETLSSLIAASNGGAEEVICVFRQMRQENFQNQAIYIFNGWIFAECEAQLCAIFSRSV